MAVIAGQIGSNQFTAFEIEPLNYASVIESLKRPGTDYHAYKLQGFEFPEQDLFCQQQFSTHSLALAANLTYNGYVGTNQTLIRGAVTYGVYRFLKPQGSDYPKITPPKRLGLMVGDPGGNTSGFMIQVTFRVQRQS